MYASRKGEAQQSIPITKGMKTRKNNHVPLHFRTSLPPLTHLPASSPLPAQPHLAILRHNLHVQTLPVHRTTSLQFLLRNDVRQTQHLSQTKHFVPTLPNRILEIRQTSPNTTARKTTAQEQSQEDGGQTRSFRSSACSGDVEQDGQDCRRREAERTRTC